MLNFLVCLTCILFIGPADELDHDLPESVQHLIEQNAEVARRITSSAYFLQTRMTSPHNDDQVLVAVQSTWTAPGEFRSSNSTITYARNDAGLADEDNILSSGHSSAHTDLNTRLRRGWGTGEMLPETDCDDPCTCKVRGSIGLVDGSERVHSNLGLLEVLMLDWETHKTSITLADFLTTASEVRYKGRDQMDGHWCAIVEVKYYSDNDLLQTYWFDESRNGLVLCRETWFDGKLSTRMKCTRAHEAFPGVFIPGEISVFTIVNADDPTNEVAELNNKRELVTLSFSPDEWPHAGEKDFGFRLMPNSIVHDRRVQPNVFKAIGKDIDDVLFTFYRSHELERWCAERSGRPVPQSSVPINSISRFREDLVDVSTPSAYGPAVIVAMIVIAAGATLLFYRRMRG